MDADEIVLVVGDLSTLSANALFELGVRYGSRPRATAAIAESGFKNPFDTNKGNDAEESRPWRTRMAGSAMPPLSGTG